MATVHPKTFFQFAADHHELLKALYDRRDGIAETELLAMARTFAAEGGPSASYVLDRLKDLGFIDYAPQATAQYEMTRPFAELMGHLLREYRLTSVEVIRSYFTAMDHMAAELEQAGKDQNGDVAVRALQEVSDHAERMRHDSRRNRDQVVAESVRIKANRDRIPPARRYAIINRLWTRYLVPLRDMIDTQKAMDASLDRMERALDDASLVFAADAAVLGVVGMGAARIQRLRRDVVADFRESMREIAPLYEELRRENALARGASHALEQVGLAGLASLRIPAAMGICNWQQMGLFSDDKLESFLLDLRQYVPARPDAVGDATSPPPTDLLSLADFDAAVRAALPIDDALAWLLAAYPDARLAHLLRLYGRLHAGTLGTPRFAADVCRYPAPGDIVLSAHPMRIDPAHRLSA